MNFDLSCHGIKWHSERTCPATVDRMPSGLACSSIHQKIRPWHLWRSASRALSQVPNDFFLMASFVLKNLPFFLMARCSLKLCWYAALDSQNSYVLQKSTRCFARLAMWLGLSRIVPSSPAAQQSAGATALGGAAALVNFTSAPARCARTQLGRAGKAKKGVRITIFTYFFLGHNYKLNYKWTFSAYQRAPVRPWLHSSGSRLLVTLALETRWNSWVSDVATPRRW